MGAAAVDEDETRLADIAPGQEFDVGALDRDAAAFGRKGQGGLEPVRRRRLGPGENPQRRADLRREIGLKRDGFVEIQPLGEGGGRGGVGRPAT